jgi:ArsR family transcriptional regulator, arsenate/arsenite/antimonite-responsive transcriptional repressor
MQRHAPMSALMLSVRDADDLSAVFAALSDPVRLRLYSLIALNGETCSCNLEGPLGRSQPTISHHTKVLSEAGLIIGEKRGRWMWWRIIPGRLESVLALLESSPIRVNAR